MKHAFWISQSFYNENDCREIYSNLSRDREHCNLNDNPASSEKRAEVDLIHWRQAKEYLTPLYEYAHAINQSAFGFHLYPFTGHNCLNFNRYYGDKQGKYDWHNDGFFNEIRDTKLTVLLNISPGPYSGGEFALFLTGGPKTITAFAKPGDVIVFPSWIQHRVLPITSGERSTVTLWLEGPNFK
jgi:PKHD-type hydroxylase